mgnify:CR=1 FL=1
MGRDALRAAQARVGYAEGAALASPRAGGGGRGGTVTEAGEIGRAHG